MKTQSTIKIINSTESDKMAFAQLFFATPPRRLLPQSHASMLSQLGNKLRGPADIQRKVSPSGECVCEVDDSTLKCAVEFGGMLCSKKGCNLPRTVTDLPAIGDKDKEDILFGIENGACLCC